MKSNILNRQMPVFISSTFRDMQDERDVIIKETFPKLRVFAAQRMVSLTPIDLRWGITEKEAKSGKILELCLHEIERSQPFFVGILGNRYGWCPGMKDLKANSMLLDQYKWLKTDIEDGLSVTEIEMQFAVLRRNEHSNALFFIKRNEITQDIKQERLISKIKSEGINLETLISGKSIPSEKGNFYFAYYDKPDELAGLLEKAMTRIIEAVFPIEGDDEWTREDNAQQAYLKELCDVYIPTAHNASTIYYMNKMLVRYLMISSGRERINGKSAFLANWLNNLAEDDAYNYVYHFLGVGFMGGNIQKILKRICKKVASLYGLEMPDNVSLQNDYSEILSLMLSEIAGRKPLFIVLDGLQHLQENAKNLEWIPTVPENVSVIVSAPNHDTSYHVFNNRFDSGFELWEIQGEEIKLFVEKYLRKFGKRLSDSKVKKICSAYWEDPATSKGRNDILALKSLLNELIIFGSHEDLDERIDFFCEYRMCDFYPKMFSRIEEDFGQEVFRRILCLIAFSKEGLSEPEILDISKANAKEWSQVYYSIPYLLTLRDGKYYIDKMTIFRQVKLCYGSYELPMRRLLVDYFSASTDERAVEECLFQNYMMEQHDAMYNILLDTDTFSHLYHHALADLIIYWKMLYDSGSRKRYSMGRFADLSLEACEKNAHALAEIGQFAKQIMGDIHSAEELFYKSLRMYESISHSDYEMLANVYMEANQYDRAMSCIEKAFHIAKQSPGGFIHLAELMSSKASLLFETDKAEDAVALYQEALEIVQNNQAKTSLTALVIYRSLGNVCTQTKYWEMAKDYIEKTISLTKKWWGASHAYMGDAYYLYGIYHKEMGHFVEASTFFSKALHIYNDWYPANHAIILLIQEYMNQMQDMTMASFSSHYSHFSIEGHEVSEVPREITPEILNFFEGIVDDLYLVDQDWEEGMKEYVYNFKNQHDCIVSGDRYMFSAGQSIIIFVDDSGRYVSGEKAFDTLKDALLNNLLHYFGFSL